MKKSLSFHYFSHQAAYWAVSGTMFAFSVAILLDKGFSSSTIGVLLACGSLLSCITQPWIASIADRAKDCILPRLIILLTIINTSIFCVLLLLPIPRLVFGGIFLISFCIHDMITPLLNSLSVHFTHAGYSINYGAGRGVGCLSFSIASFLMGHAIQAFGINCTTKIGIVLCVLIIFITLRYPIEPKAVSTSTRQENSCSVLEFIKRYRWYCISLIGFGLMGMYLSITENYMISIMEYLGGNTSHSGTAIALASGAGVPVLFLFNIIRSRFSDERLLKIAGICFIIRSVIMMLAPNITVVYLAELTQIVTYALLSPIQVYYAEKRIAPADMVKGQSFITAVYSLGCAAGNLAGGALLDYFNVPVMLTFGMVMTVIGALILFFTVNKNDLKQTA